jgi:hypothetical protein
VDYAGTQVSAGAAATWNRLSQLHALGTEIGKTFGSNHYLGVTTYMFPTLAGVNYHVTGFSAVAGDARLDPDPFAARPIPQELALCQRYYLGNHFGTIRGYLASTTSLANGVYFPVEMRVPPSVVAGTAIATGNVGQEAYETITTKGFRFRVTAAAPGDTFVLERVLHMDAEFA